MMFHAKHIGAALVGMTFLLASTAAFAIDPEICDPEEDEYECQCSTQDWDGCGQIQYSDLLDPNDPEEVREATELEATWNSEEELYEVTLDVSELNNGAIIPLLDNRGGGRFRCSF